MTFKLPWKNQKLQLSKDPLILGGFLAALFATVAGFFSLALSFLALPSHVPLLFTATSQLAPKGLLLVVPLLSLIFIFLNAWLAEILLRREDRPAALFPAFVSTFVSVILTLSLLGIIKIFPIPLLPKEEVIYPLLTPLFFSAAASFIVTPLLIQLARKLRLFDRPHGPYPKVKSIPRLGALPIFLAFSATALWLSGQNPQVVALVIGAAIITLVQAIDDLHPLPPLAQGLGHLLAAAVVVLGGVGVDYITNPLRGLAGPDFIRFDSWQVNLALGSWQQAISVWSAFLTVGWIFALVNVVDWLDGLDGLATGVGAIVAGAIVVISLILNTPETAILGTILLGSLLGFLPFNFFPAQIYLGGGAFLLGYLLAVLAIFSGAKAGTATLVLAVPIIDAFYVIYSRLRRGLSPFKGDQTHLHHRLLKVGVSHPKIVAAEWAFVLALAVAAVALKGSAKFAAIVLVFAGTLLANRLLLRKPA
ncbi:MAG: MraY family glycosyltransferase [Patescibacteria group bacterium]